MFLQSSDERNRPKGKRCEKRECCKREKNPACRWEPKKRPEMRMMSPLMTSQAGTNTSRRRSRQEPWRSDQRAGRKLGKEIVHPPRQRRDLPTPPPPPQTPPPVLPPPPPPPPPSL